MYENNDLDTRLRCIRIYAFQYAYSRIHAGVGGMGLADRVFAPPHLNPLPDYILFA